MAYEVTATRKRPQQFETLAGQEFVVSTITNAITQGRIAHAYLFSGPRGVGKTTTARLLAKALNCENGPTAHPCGECSNCVEITRGCCTDVIEIDGASNTSVNDVRNIKDEISFPPQHSRYKIYIIDEVHMLSNSAFNALLKTIEEPPEYVIFIFATTETQKVPATIRSRCQQFNFQLLNIETIKGLLRETCGEIGVQAEDEALFWIAKEATGSMRDAYTLFDQVVSFSDGEITIAKIRSKLGIIGIDSLNAIMGHIVGNRPAEAISTTLDLLSRGVSIEQCIKDFADYFRVLLLIRKGITSESVLGQQVSAFPKEIRNAYTEEQLETAFSMFLQLYRDIRYSLNPRFELELAISRLGTLKYLASSTIVLEQIARLKNDLLQGKLTPTNEKLRDIPDVAPQESFQLAADTPAQPEAVRETPPPAPQAAAREPVATPLMKEVKREQTAETPAQKPVAPAQKPVAPAPRPAAPAPAAAPSAPQPASGRVLTSDDIEALVKYTAEHDPTLYTIVKQIIDLKSENNVAKMAFGSFFAEKSAQSNIKNLTTLLSRVLGFEGALVFSTIRKQEPETVAAKEETKDEVSKMIEQMFGGIKE